MTATLDLAVGVRHPAFGLLRDYVESVAAEFGVGLESCTIDEDTPVSAYVALDLSLPHLPDRDVALLWHEERGWAVGVETRGGEDVVIVRHLGESVCPAPARVARFVSTVRTETPARPAENRSAILRRAGSHDELAELLREHRRSRRSS